MAETLDTLQLNITSNAKSAVNGINNVSNALAGLKGTLKGGGFSQLKKIGESLAAFKNINTDFKGLSEALTKLGETKISSSVAKGIEAIRESLGKLTEDDIKKAERLSTALSGLGTVRLPNGGGSRGIQPEAKKSTSTIGEASGVKKIGEVFKGLGNNLKFADKNVRTFRDDFKQLTNSLGRIALYRALRSVIKAVGDAFKEGKQNLYGWSQEIGGASYGKSENFATLLDRLATNTLYFHNAIGTLSANFINMFAPGIESVIDVVVELINQMNRLFAVLRGDTTYNKAIKKQTEFSKETGKAAKEIKNLVFGFDELNIIPAQSGSGSSNSMDYSGMFEEVSTQGDGLRNSLTSLKESIWPDAISIVTAGGAVVAALNGRPLLAAGLLGISIGAQVMQDAWEGDKLGSLLKPLLVHATRIIGVTSGVVLALRGHPFAGAAVAGISLAAANALEDWDGSLEGLKGLIPKLTGDAVTILSIVGGIALGIAGHPIAGIALAGVGIGLGAALSNAWDGSLNGLRDIIPKVTGIAISALSIMGGILLATSGHVVAGIALAGLGIGLGTLVSGWSTSELKDHALRVSEIALSLGLVLGGLYLMMGGHVLPGVAMLTAGGVAIAMTASGNGWAEQIKAIKDALNEIWKSVKTWWDEKIDPILEKIRNFKRELADLKTRVSDVKSNFDTSLFQPGMYASGGTPQTGTLFWAGEAGPEVVTSVGNHSTVYNENQLASAMSGANEELINVIIQVANNVVAAINDKDTNVYLSDRDVAASASRGARLNGTSMVV